MNDATTIEIARAALVDFDLSLVYHLVLFLFTVVVLNTLVFKPMLRVEALRHQKTQGAIEAAERAQAESQRRVRDYEQQVTATRKQGSESFAQQREQAQRQASDDVEAARRVAEDKLTHGTRALQERYGVAKRQVTTKAKELSELVAERVLPA